MLTHENPARNRQELDKPQPGEHAGPRCGVDQRRAALNHLLRRLDEPPQCVHLGNYHDTGAGVDEYKQCDGSWGCPPDDR